MIGTASTTRRLGRKAGEASWFTAKHVCVTNRMAPLTRPRIGGSLPRAQPVDRCHRPFDGERKRVGFLFKRYAQLNCDNGSPMREPSQPKPGVE